MTSSVCTVDTASKPRNNIYTLIISGGLLIFTSIVHFLPPLEPATLIVVDLREVEMNELRQEYSNAKNFDDRDIFRHLRRAHLAGDTSAKARWLYKLSRTKIRDVNLLEKRASKDAQTQHLQIPLTTCSHSPACGRRCRLEHFIGYFLCGVPRRASYSITPARANNVGRK